MNRLTAFRYLEGLTQPELGELLGVPVQRVSEVERGIREASFDVTVLGYSAERMQFVPDMSEPLHRQLARTKESTKKRAKEVVRVGGELFTQLRPTTRVRVILERESSNSPRDLDDLESMAADVRVGVLGLEEDVPILNLTAAVERSGVAMVPIANPADRSGDPTCMDGLSSWVGGHQPVVGLDHTVSGERFRFSLAHEIGHLILHSRKHDATEEEANRFAGALLVPPGALEFALPKRPTLRDFMSLKKRWGVSVAALLYRARDLGLIDQNRYRSLQIQKSTTWGRLHEPNDSEVTTGLMLAKMVEAGGGPDMVAEATGISAKHVRLVTDWTQRRHLELLR